MTSWRTAFVDSNHLRIHYTRTGGDKPPLVLAHGFSDHGPCWTPVAEQLCDAYDVIMVDARGHGRSDGPEQGYAITDLATDLAGVVSALGLHKPVVMGHSMGGATTLVLAGLYPELPGAIVVEDAGGANLATSARPDGAQRRRQMSNRLVELKRKTRDELIAHARSEMPSWSEAELGPWADAKLRFSIHALARLGTSVPDWETVVAQIRCPALLITADTDRGGLVSAAEAESLQQLIPQLQVAHVPEAGHNIRREQFARYMQAVRTFLHQVHS